MSRTDQVIEAVRRLDALEIRRKQITEGIDREIAGVRREIAELTGDAKPKGKAKGRQSTIGTATLEVIRANPRADNGEVAVKVYGKDTPQNRHKARATFFNLKMAGRIKRTADGAWEIVGQSANGAAMH